MTNYAKCQTTHLFSPNMLYKNINFIFRRLSTPNANPMGSYFPSILFAF